MSKVAAITGAASGIGRGTAKRLLAEGWTVLALDRDGAGLEALRRDFLAGGDRLHTEVCDVTSAPSVATAFQAIGRRFGRLNGLVCSAGLLRFGTLEAMPVEDFDALFAVNVRGLWLSAREAMPLLKVAGRSGGSTSDQAGSEDAAPAAAVTPNPARKVRREIDDDI